MRFNAMNYSEDMLVDALRHRFGLGDSMSDSDVLYCTVGTIGRSLLEIEMSSSPLSDIVDAVRIDIAIGIEDFIFKY